MILVILLYSVLGFTFTLSKILSNYAPPFFLVGSRMLIAGCLLGLYTYWSYSHKSTKTSRDDWFLMLQFSIFGIVVPHVSRAWALQFLPTVKASLLFNTGPFFSAVFAYLLLKEKLTILQIAGLAIGFGGTLPLLLSNSSVLTQTSLFSFTLPDVMVLIAIASLSYSLFIMQRLVKHRNISPVFANAVSMIAGGFIALNASCWTESTWIKTPHSFISFIGLLCLNISISNLFCANLQAWLLKKHSSTLLAFASFLSPAFTALYGWLLLGETITWNILLSFFLVLIGLTVYFYGETSKQFFNKKPQQIL